MSTVEQKTPKTPGSSEKHIIFMFPGCDLGIPLTHSIPDSVVDMCSDEQDMKNIQIMNPEIVGDRQVAIRKVHNKIYADIIMGYITQDLNIAQLCKLVPCVINIINISKGSIIMKIKSHIIGISTETYTWNQLASNTEYSYRQFNKRNWPVKKKIILNGRRLLRRLDWLIKYIPVRLLKSKNADLVPWKKRKINTLVLKNPTHKTP